MKLYQFILLGLIIGLISCEKENSKPIDYRNSVIGEYAGIRIDTYWINATVGYGHDTTAIIINLSKSDLDSIIDISFNPTYSDEDFSFKYVDGQFISTTYYHPPILTLVNDSLYFKHQGGLGPIWTECFTKKSD